ncbi:hypothetical protein DXG03_007086 [Asterophora parasitica]|uniref:Peroxisomal membrane protein PEX14 n=1 Tax=Asterophora parasitica TaxID=117018 RepID=A0A9P7GDT6_9AGAR|nr:hypothetical protein DXG03_007086 [Asterophora parasitica]
MSSPNRQELIQNAVAFLADPKSQGSPLAQRIQFLEAKGLTPPEIDIALKQAIQNNHVSGSVAYGAVTLYKVWSAHYALRSSSNFAYVQKYLLPHLQPPSSTAYEEDRDALTAQFDAAEALLKEIQAESAAVRIAIEEQKDKIDKTTANVEAVVVEMREGETKTRDEMREIRDEVNNIREMLPKVFHLRLMIFRLSLTQFQMIEKNKESQTQSLSELQQELKSLKALLLSRGPSSIPASPLPTLGRPAIPAWQLASAPPQSPSSASGSSHPVVQTSSAPIVSNAKGKDVTSSPETLHS